MGFENLFQNTIDEPRDYCQMSSTINTALTELFGIKYPIMLAGMNVAAGPGLAAAVTNAGGIGVIGVRSRDACQWSDRSGPRGHACLAVRGLFLEWRARAAGLRSCCECVVGARAPSSLVGELHTLPGNTPAISCTMIHRDLGDSAASSYPLPLPFTKIWTTGLTSSSGAASRRAPPTPPTCPAIAHTPIASPFSRPTSDRTHVRTPLPRLPRLATPIHVSHPVSSQGLGYTPKMLRVQIEEIKDGLVDKNGPFGIDLLLPAVGGSARKTN